VTKSALDDRFDFIRGDFDGFVRPNPHDDPTCIRETAVGIAIAFDVAFDLCAPPGAIVFGPGSVMGTSMPKAAVDEHGRLRKRKDDVDGSSAALQNSTMEAEAKATPVQFRTQIAFACIIPLRCPRHPLGRCG
jgi:hypothetical protein